MKKILFFASMIVFGCVSIGCSSCGQPSDNVVDTIDTVVVDSAVIEQDTDFDVVVDTVPVDTLF